MSTLGLMVLGLGLAVGLTLLFAWRRTANLVQSAANRDNLNVSLYREHLAELEAMLARGSIDQRRFAALKTELDRQLLSDTSGNVSAAKVDDGGWGIWIPAFIVAIPLLAWLLYLQIGGSHALGTMQLLEELSGEPSAARRDDLRHQLLKRLEHSSHKARDDGFRYMLAHQYLELGRAEDAAAEFERLSARYTDDGELLGSLIRARFIAANGRMTPDLRQLASRALNLNPHQPGLLSLLGMDGFQRGDFAAAQTYWGQLLRQLPPDSDEARLVRDGIDAASRQLGEQPVTSETQVAAISVTVQLGEGIDANPGDEVYVFAKAINGPPMPLAVSRLTVADLPAEVRLDDTLAMSPALRLSAFKKVKVVARISRQGGPQARAGDIQGESEELSLDGGITAVEVTVNQKIAG